MLLMMSMPVLADEAKSTTNDERAACMKSCAGAPKDATPQKLMQCLSQCEDPRDGGAK